MTFQFSFTPTVKLKRPGVRGILSAHEARNIICAGYNCVARSHITGLPEVRVTQYIYSCDTVLSPLSYACLVYEANVYPRAVRRVHTTRRLLYARCKNLSDNEYNANGYSARRILHSLQ